MYLRIAAREEPVFSFRLPMALAIIAAKVGCELVVFGLATPLAFGDFAALVFWEAGEAVAGATATSATMVVLVGEG